MPDPGLCVPGGRVPEGSGSGGEDRMARQPRLNIAEGVDHVTQRGVEQRDIVVDDEDRLLRGADNNCLSQFGEPGAVRPRILG